jgi:hypothetical protein
VTTPLRYTRPRTVRRPMGRTGAWLDPTESWTWKATQTYPWVRRAKNRAANKVARRSRKRAA